VKSTYGAGFLSEAVCPSTRENRSQAGGKNCAWKGGGQVGNRLPEINIKPLVHAWDGDGLKKKRQLQRNRQEAEIGEELETFAGNKQEHKKSRIRKG